METGTYLLTTSMFIINIYFFSWPSIAIRTAHETRDHRIEEARDVLRGI